MIHQNNFVMRVRRRWLRSPLGGLLNRIEKQMDWIEEILKHVESQDYSWFDVHLEAVGCAREQRDHERNAAQQNVQQTASGVFLFGFILGLVIAATFALVLFGGG